MATVGLGQALRSALELLDAGRAAEAEALCRRIVDAAPYSADAHGLHGLALAQSRARPAAAATAFLRALFLDPTRRDAAQSTFRLLEEDFRAGAAADLIRALACAAPGDGDVWRLLSAAPETAAQPAVVLSASARALRLDPMQATTHVRRAGLLAAHADDFAGAGRGFRAALVIEPASVAAWFNYALISTRGGSSWRNVAAAAARRAAALAPDDPGVRILDARHHLSRGDVAAAAAAARHAAAAAPSQADAWDLLATCAENEGRPDDAVRRNRRAYRLTGAAAAGARLQLALNLTDAAPAVILEAARAWACAHAEPLTRAAPAPPPPPPGVDGRPLRVGYLIEYFLTHDATIMPIIEGHTTAAESVIYALRRPAASEREARYRRAARLYRDCADMDESAVADLIRADGVDVLVEGTGFASSRSSFLILARRPAPIQLHFPVMTTTGMSATDACLADAVTAPPGAEAFFTEHVARLPVGYHAELPKALPDVAPRIGGGGLVFGSFNTLNKITAPVLRVWAEILRRLPDARLLIKASDMSATGETRLRGVLSGECGVAAERLDVRPATRSYHEHLQTFNDIDVHLDSFPYGGVTTTAEAFWMGRPVVTMAGTRVLDRYSASFLTLLGMRDLAADDAQGYIAAACAVAADGSRRARLLQNLRADTAASPMSDRRIFVAALEQTYFRLWRERRSAGAA